MYARMDPDGPNPGYVGQLHGHRRITGAGMALAALQPTSTPQPTLSNGTGCAAAGVGAQGPFVH